MNSSLKNAAPVILRIGLALVVMWFGLSEVIHPSQWVSYIPLWAVSATGIKVATLVILNGAFEILMSLLLAFGIWSRWAALLLFVHMVGIVTDVGLSAVGVRDVGLAFGLLAITFQGGDAASLTE